MIQLHSLLVAYITVVITSWILAGAVGAGVGGAIHLVQIVDVYVLYTVEVTIPVETLLRPPIVMVFVSGHTVSYSVVLLQLAMADIEFRNTHITVVTTSRVLGVGVGGAIHLVQTVEV